VEKTLGFLGTYNVDLSYSIKVKKPVMEFWFLVRRRRGIRKAQWEKISESHWAHNDRAEHGGKEREMEKRQMCSTIWEAPFALRNLMKNFFQQGKQFVVCFLIFMIGIFILFCVLCFVCLFLFFCFFVFGFCCCLFYGLLLDFLHLIINYVCVFLFVLLFFCCIFYF